LIIAGPKQNFLESEVRALQDYLKQGGSLILAVEPQVRIGLDGLMAEMKIKLQDNFVVSVLDTPMGKAVDPRATPGTIFSTTNQITKPFGKNEFTVFRMPSGLVKLDTTGSKIVTDEIVKTGVAVLAFRDLKFNHDPEKGPFTLAMTSIGKFPGAAESAKDFNAVVFGDSDFLTNQFLYKNLNRDLMLNSVAFLAKEENLISITPKEVQRSEMVLTETQMILFIFGFIIPLPLLLFASGGFLWYRRRNA
jgi:ABC-type uncharacterized transport system involved in gliding motility auxiliary subunit